MEEGGRKAVAKDSLQKRVTTRKVQKKRMRKSRLVVKLPWKKNRVSVTDSDTKEQEQEEIEDLEVLTEIIRGKVDKETNQPETKVKKVEVRLSKLKVKQAEEDENDVEELPAPTGRELGSENTLTEREMITLGREKSDALDKDLSKTIGKGGGKAMDQSSSKTLGHDGAKTLGQDVAKTLGQDGAKTLGQKHTLLLPAR